MKQLARQLGTITFWAAWPVLFLYLQGSQRTRIVLVCDGDVLAIRGWLSDGKWSLPGGGIKRGERITRAAIRELHEETGLTLTQSSLRFLCKGESRQHGWQFTIHCFVVELQHKPVLKRQRHEIADMQWLSPLELDEHNAGPDVLIPLQAWVQQ
ncbi:MAG TPA: NUDIX hydrolase [Nevskiaceae bacterium]|nr:NUDIX hydrolase [Nevskiaceae bacterium]